MHSHLIRNTLVSILLFGGLCFIRPTIAETNSISKAHSLTPSDIPRFFESTNAIKLYFEQIKVPATARIIKNGNDTYCFALAYPYSGVDTTDLYCFVKRDRGFALFLKSFIWKAPFEEHIQFKTEGDFVNVIVKDVVILKINPPR